jgi:hypothetical protein
MAKIKTAKWVWIGAAGLLLCCLAGFAVILWGVLRYVSGCPQPACSTEELILCPKGDCLRGCGLTCMTVTPYEPQVMCTAPACKAGEKYYCSGVCPGGCGTTCATTTPEYPFIECTPPACKEGEIYYCSADCPGGCGVSCVTPTPYIPRAMCTPPACKAGEEYSCKGDCYGGCGTTCATPTPY